eukprot:CAMPEP_0174901204 /NCGR_PEP_ID=MMETSP0167-20121228/33783_1 /TAXON_ID=38298 /ORGANISM="Rhodella maculata, Strain CCMP736" /LENGTH=82 /DNA_ID=CAMNT_0016142825 /DNA_START=297 /DNA_END=545 /DNA_ORIENTATION=+
MTRKKQYEFLFDRFHGYPATNIVGQSNLLVDGQGIYAELDEGPAMTTSLVASSSPPAPSSSGRLVVKELFVNPRWLSVGEEY